MTTATVSQRTELARRTPPTGLARIEATLAHER
jgi:hypothetical protein